MGTTLSVRVAAPSRAEGIQSIEGAFEAVRRVDSMLSTWRDDSEIARLNQAPPGQAVRLTPNLYRHLREAAHWSRLTGGAFDPGIGSLVDAWDLRGSGAVPSAGLLSAARAASGIHRFVFADGQRTISRTDRAGWIDTGGFGKGVALRDARRALRACGIQSGILNFGGQVLVFGSNGDRGEWIVPVAHPSRRAHSLLRLRVHAGSASTSSQSERFAQVGQRRIGHILDPRSGEPVPAWGSVTAIAEDPVVADVVSTALLVLGPERGLQWARDRRDVGVLFLVEREGRVERLWNRAMDAYLVGSRQSSVATHPSRGRTMTTSVAE